MFDEKEVSSPAKIDLKNKSIILFDKIGSNHASNHNLKISTNESSPNFCLKNYSTTFENASSSKELLIQEKQSKERSDNLRELKSTEQSFKKAPPQYSNNMQNLFKYYFRKKNVKSEKLKISLNKKLKENVKLKREIIDLIENVKSSNQNMIHNTNDEKNVGTAEEKILIDELDKKESFLSANINRNILALEDFMNLNQTASDEKKDNGVQNLQSKYKIKKSYKNDSYLRKIRLVFN
jgi:hypothetical protein